MSKEMRFLVFAIEHYRQAKGLTGPEVAALFRERDSRSTCWTIISSTT